MPKDKRKGTWGECLCGNRAPYRHSGQYICDRCLKLSKDNGQHRTNSTRFCAEAPKRAVKDAWIAHYYVAHTVRPDYPTNWSCNANIHPGS